MDTRDANPWHRPSGHTLLAGAVLVAIALLGVIRGAHRRCVDFAVYHSAALRFIHGTSLYRVSDLKMPFKYPAPVAWMVAPFGLLPVALGAALWNLAWVVALAVALRLLPELFDERGIPPWSRALALVALVHPLFLVAYYGQAAGAVLAILVVSAVLDRRGRPAAAGLALAAATLLKLPAGLLALYFLYRRRHRVVVWAAAFGAATWVPVGVRYGAGTLDLLHRWTATLARTTPPWSVGYNTQGLPALVLSLVRGEHGIPSHGSIVAVQLVLVVAFAATVLALRPARAELFAVLCAGAALLSPLAWRANYVLLLPAVVVAATHRPRWTGWAALAAAFLPGLIAGEGLLPLATFKHVMLDRPFTVGALVVVALVLATRRAEPTPAPAPG